MEKRSRIITKKSFEYTASIGGDLFRVVIPVGATGAYSTVPNEVMNDKTYRHVHFDKSHDGFGGAWLPEDILLEVSCRN